ncbi:MAG TPA: aldo/keto reductase [Gemmatimonadaceae bacterium]|nr:aldo/keto reductase [Gemmatimonadaceae bacterium]
MTTLRRRAFGRTGWSVGALGVGMWGMGGWTGSDDAESLEALQLAVDLGCNFFDTALAYGDGKSERLLSELVRRNPGTKLYAATKVPPLNREWPSRREFSLDEVFPPEHIRQSTEQSLENLGMDQIDLLQFHVWEDSWADDERWQRVIDDLKRERLIAAAGISINRWEPWNGLRTVRTGMVDSVQVIYNIFDQAPEDELFPLCRELDVAVIARVPFDEGSLTGTLTRQTRWPDGDWRNVYFGPENLEPTVERVERLKSVVPVGSSLPELALRFILSNADVSVVIPGMRRPSHVRANVASSDKGALSPPLLADLREHRWDREPTEWSH